MILNVASEYEEAVKPSREQETLFTKSLQMWLRPFSEDINQQNGKLVLLYAKDGTNRFRLENIDEALQEKIANRFPKFVSR